jgi:hypothetical protein
MAELNGIKKNYLRNTKTSNSRTVRLEIVGEVCERERHFLDGISFFVAGTMTRNDPAYTNYVADKMIALVKELIAKIKPDKEAGK